MFSFASRKRKQDVLENAVDCLTGCGASSPRSPQASGSSEIQRNVLQVNDSLYLFHKPEGTPNVQILFFHGLQCGPDYSSAHVSTWENHDGSCIWPQTWLVEDFPKAHVLSVCYTEGLKKGSNGTVDMYIIGENLVSDLLLENIGSSCPVILVGHSVGGLILKQLCNQAHDMLHRSSEPRATKLRSFLNSIKGVFYYSTPHHGIPIVNRLKDHFGSSILIYFTTLSKDTERLNCTFDDISKLHYNWLFAGLGETLPTKLGPFVDVVVPEASARIAGNFNLVKGADHFSICRPRSKILSNFSKLQKFIHRITNDLKEDHQNATTSKVARVPLLPFLRDPKYVVFKTTMLKVQEALESKTTGPVVTLCGGPGQGKTSMAKYLALYYQNASILTQSPKRVQIDDLASKDLASSKFIDGVVFLPCGPNAATKDLLLKLWETFGYELLPSMEVMHGYASSNNVGVQQAVITESFLSNELTRRLSTQKVLIVLDDVCEPAIIETLLFPGQWLKYLVTTQIPQLWGDARCLQIPLNRPTSEEAYQILTNHVYGGPKDITEQLQGAIHAIVEKADHLPLVLANMAAFIHGGIQGGHIDELEEWKNIIKYFEDLIQAKDANSSVVLFNHAYPKTMITCMEMALGSLEKPARTLLLVASIFDSQIVPVPEVVIKLFFKRVYGSLAKFSWCSMHLQYNNFIQVESNDVARSTLPANKTWSLHAMRQTFIETVQGEEVKSMGDKFLESRTEEDILMELLLLYGQDQWRDQAAKTLGIEMFPIKNDSFQARSLQLAPIKSFVRLLHADTKKQPWEERSHGLAKHILRTYIRCDELDDSSLSILLSTNETVLQTLEALKQFYTGNLATPVIPKTMRVLTNVLEATNNNLANVLHQVPRLLAWFFTKTPNRLEFISIPDALNKLFELLAQETGPHVQGNAALAFGHLALDVETRIKIMQFPNVIGRLVALLAEDVGEHVQRSAALALGNLASDVETGIKIIQFPNVIGRLVALLAEDVGEHVQRYAALALGNLASDVETRIKIIQFLNVIGRLVALLAEDVGEHVQRSAAFALGNLALDVETRIKIIQFPNVIGRLVALLAEDVGEDVQRYAALALGNLALDVETRIKIIQFPNAIGRLVALLAEDVGEDVQESAALALGHLALDVEIRIKIIQFPNVIGRLVALLAEDVGEDVQRYAALALGNLALDVETRIKIIQFPNAIGRLAALLAEDVGKDVQESAALALGHLALDVEIGIKIIQFPNVIGRLVALLAEDVGEDVQRYAALALGHLALDVETRIKIIQFPNAIGRLVALLAEDVGEDVQESAALALGHLALDVETGIKIIQFPNVIGRLAALLAEDVGEDVQESAALALGHLALDVETGIKIIQFPNVIGRLVALLAEDVGERVQRYAALALGNLALDVETGIKIIQFPNAIGRLVALLAEDVGERVQRYAALALGHLALDVETRIKIIQFPNVIGRLVALLAEDVGEKVQESVTFALGNLTLDVETRIKLIQIPNVMDRLLCFLANGWSQSRRTSVVKVLRLLTVEVQGGDYKGVLQGYEGGNCGLLRLRCFVQAKCGDFDGALTDINKFIELGGSRGFGLQERGIVRRMKGDLHGALADLNESLSPEPDDYECLKHRGLVKFLLSDESGARADAECALRVKPGCVDTYEYGKRLVLGTMSVKFLDYNLK